jgi:hypothetical protein
MWSTRSRRLCEWSDEPPKQWNIPENMEYFIAPCGSRFRILIGRVCGFVRPLTNVSGLFRAGLSSATLP